MVIPVVREVESSPQNGIRRMALHRTSWLDAPALSCDIPLREIKEMTELKRITWHQKYEIGVKRIDFEHQIFADLINGLADKIASGKDKLSLAKTLREIIKYADFHFTSEENIMEDCGYPGFKEHVEIHRALQRTLNDKVMAMVGDNSSPADILNFLSDWFLDHTVREDSRISLYTMRH